MNWVIKIMGVFWTRRESMSKIYHFICWICCFTKRLKPWISNLGCRAELFATGTELAWDHGENLRDAKGLPNKDGFQLEQEMKGLPRAGYCCDLLPTELQREGHCCGRGRELLTGCLGAAAALWYLQKLGSSFFLVGTRKKPSHNCLSRQKTGVFPLSKSVFGFSLCHPLPDGGEHRWVSGLLSLQQDSTNKWALLQHPVCCSATNSFPVHCLLHHTFFPVIFTTSLSHSQSSYMKNTSLLPFSRCLSHLYFGWNGGVEL